MSKTKMTCNQQRTARAFAALWPLLLLCLAALTARAQTPSDADWTGTWVGTYSAPTICPGVTNFGNFVLTINVSGGVVSGAGLEENVNCYDGYCNVFGFGTISGSVSGSTSGSNLTFSGSWFDSCNNRDYAENFSATLSNGTITGSQNIILVKQAPANVCVVDGGIPYQRIEGFGGSCAFLGGLNWTPAWADMFFSTNNGIGLSMVRSSINPDGTTSEANIMQMAQARGAKIWSAPWTPPANFKDSGSVNGGRFLSTYNQDYANELANYVANMKAQYGINIYALSVQNEPNYNTFLYESCVWTGQQFHDFVPYLSQALASNGMSSTRIMIAEEEQWDFDLCATTMNDPVTAPMVGILAAHGYWQQPSQAFYWNTSVWQTEDSTLDQYDGSMDNGMYWAEQLHGFMTVSQINEFNYWWLIPLGTDNEGLTDINGNPAKRLYVLGQFSRFVRPGYVRIGAYNTDQNLITAYQDPATGNFAIVAINPNYSDSTETFALTNFNSALVTPWMTSSTNSLEPQPSLVLTNSTFTYTLPARSVVTFVGQTNNVVILQQPQSQEVAAGDQVSFSVNIYGAAPLSYQWEENGVNLAGATNSSFTLTNVPAADNGAQFVCVISNAQDVAISIPATLTVANPLYCFHGYDGSSPNGGLVQAGNGILYGTAQLGGSYGLGTVFGLTTNGLLQTLVSFNGTNGATPGAGLTLGADGALYGTTENGGTQGDGTFFRLSLDGNLTLLYSFDSSIGAHPASALALGHDGNFYGVTGQTIFSLTSAGAINLVATLNPAIEGSDPVGSLLVQPDGSFYGVTGAGSSGNSGAVYRLGPNGALSLVAAFTGGSPADGLWPGIDRNLYGTTGNGGASASGTVFDLGAGSSLTNLISFDPAIGSGGADPLAHPVQAGNGYLYGTTSLGGADNLGIIYAMETNGQPVTVFTFDGPGGANPQSSLLPGSDGSFYGTTPYGGIGWSGSSPSGHGVVYRLPFPTPPAITTQASSVETGLGTTVNFTVSAAGNAPLTYAWWRNGAPLRGATNSFLVLTNVGTADIGNYQVIVSNSLGVASGTVVTLGITNFACTEPPAGIFAWFPAESNAVDIIGGHNGTLWNGAEFGDAFVGNGFSFNGSGSYVALPQNLFPLPQAGPLSVELWFETSSGGVILEQQAGPPLGGIPNGWLPVLYVGTNGVLYGQLFWDGAFNQIHSTEVVNDGAFHHAVLSFDGTYEALYLDGNKLGVVNLPSSTYTANFACQLGTGYTQGWAAAPNGWFTFDGLIDEISFYSSALSAAQVQSIYNAGTAGKCQDELVPTITAQPTNVVVTTGAVASFNFNVTSLSTLNYQWFEDGTNLVGATNNLLKLRATNPGQNLFFAVATNAGIALTSSVVSLTVMAAPCALTPAGVMAWWPGQSNAQDVVNGFNGSAVGGVGFTNAVVGNGFSFNGSTAYVALPQNLFPPAAGGAFSIELWFQTQTGGVILEQQNGPPLNGALRATVLGRIVSAAQNQRARQRRLVSSHRGDLRRRDGNAVSRWRGSGGRGVGLLHLYC
jgi:uncharacterized repeat protein (TIGR03803 family)